MKKLMAFTAAFSLASSLCFVFPSAAAADPGNGDSTNAAVCQQIAAANGISQGNCVSLLNRGINANTACHNFQFVDPTDYAANFSSFGACVSFVNEILGS